MKALVLPVLLVVTSLIRAESIEELRQRHRTALGGAAPVEALAAIRAEGVIHAGPRTLKFEVVAQRPNRLRISLHGEGRTTIQGWDGSLPPWQFDLAKFRLGKAMSDAEIRAFEADAEYDDPLIGGAARGYTLDDAGESQLDGHAVQRVLVTQTGAPPSWLLIDRQTALIVARETRHRLVSGRVEVNLTRYFDYRPVQGVQLAFRIEESTDGKLLRETIITDFAPIDPPAATMFEPPVRGSDGQVPP